MQRHQAAVHRYLGGLGSRPALIEDALQNTFVSAWSGAGGFRGESGVRTWLFTIARRALLRLESRRSAHSDPVSLAELGLDAGWRLAAEDPSLATLENREAVERGFQGLAPEYREALILRELEGHSNEEAARVVGVGLRAFKSRLHRARLGFLANLRKGGELGA